MNRCRYYGVDECIRQSGHWGGCCPTRRSLIGFYWSMLRLELWIHQHNRQPSA